MEQQKEPPVPPKSVDEQPQPAPQLQDAHLTVHVELAPGTRLHVTLDAAAPDGTALEKRTVVLENPSYVLPGGTPAVQAGSLAGARSIPTALRAAWRAMLAGWTSVLLAASLGLYLVIRLIGLQDFPIYFFTDEAVQTVRAADLVRDNYRGYTGEFLPTYFQNGPQYNLSLSVYLQVLPYLWFGKSVFITRAASVLVTLLAAVSVGLALRQIFHSRAAWAGVLILSVTPAWFLHSRTAFETALAVSFYALFLYFYLRYRQGSHRALFAAALAAALAFYSYSPAQMVVAVSILLLLILDFRYHWQQRRLIPGLLLFGLILALPYLRFQILHPGENLRHMQLLNSYWLEEIPFAHKLGRYFSIYLQGLDPVYWYTPYSEGLARHIMLGYGYLWRPGLPLVLLGTALCVRRIRQPEYRTLVAALLAAPAGAALVEIGVTRALFMVIPAALLAGIGLSWLLDWLAKVLKPRAPRLPVYAFLSMLLFFLLAWAGFAMLQDALVNGPTWFSDYGLNGMQYGARQLFSEVADYLEKNPQANLIISPSWSNGTDVVARFFFNDPQPFQLGSIMGYIEDYKPIGEQDVFVMIPEELEQVVESQKFSDLEVERTLPYPNGKDGFFFTRLRYIDNIEQVFAEESERRRSLVEERVTLPDGTIALTRVSPLDMGAVQDAFDGDPGSLIRTRDANPMRLLIEFDQPRRVSGVVARVGGVPTQVEAVFTPQVGPVRALTTEVPEAPNPRDVRLELDEPLLVTALELSILNVRDSEPAHVHLWEVTLP